MTSRLLAWSRSNTAGEDSGDTMRLDPETLERLRKLGYIR